MNTFEKIRQLDLRLKEIISLAQDGLLKSERLYQTKYGVEDELKNLSSEFDERTQLSIEKVIPKWRNVPKSGVFVNGDEVTKQLTPIMALINELLYKLQLPPVKQSETKDEFVIGKGEQFIGRQYLRTLFSQAKISIFIRDSYLRPEILDILTEHISDQSSLKLFFLVGNNPRRLPAFRSSLKAFIDQYGDGINGRFSSENNKDHPRCLVIDDELVFDATHSFDQWGYSTVTIHQMLDNTQKEKLLGILKSEFDVANNILEG